MGHKIKKYETGEMCRNIESIIRFAYLKETDDQGNFKVNLKMMMIIRNMNHITMLYE
jgi:hypothetical protein